MWTAINLDTVWFMRRSATSIRWPGRSRSGHAPPDAGPFAGWSAGPSRSCRVRAAGARARAWRAGPKRRILLTTQTLNAVAAGTLAAITIAGAVRPADVYA